MSIDLSRFHAVFFSESLEQLDAMEAELLRPDVENASAESINTIFRAAHSVKGGSATFGFSDISGLTHLLETILDEVRSGKRALDRDLVDILLESVDCLRELLRANQDGTPVDRAEVEALKSRLNALVDAAPSAGGPSGEEARGARRWSISFRPHAHMMQRGNDPARLLRELGELGEMSVTVDIGALPASRDLDPEACYLAWTITLDTDSGKAAIEEIFEWVEHDCDLEIEAEGAAIEPARAAPAQPEAPRTQAPQTVEPVMGAGGSIRVDVDKIDQLINLVGELIITESRLVSLVGIDSGGDITPVGQALENLSRNIRDLQESALQMRMVPVSFAFHRLPRLVRDLARELGKEVTIEIRGETTEVDKGMLENISDPMIHLVRNAVDHGIESPERRREAGKPPGATVRVRAFHHSGNVVIQVTDDGRGLDPELIRRKAKDKGLLRDDDLSDADALNLVFSPGFSTAEQVSDISGRGVGLDVVRQNIQKLGGRVSVSSTVGEGTQFTIAVPLTLSIIEGQLVRIGASTFVIPVLSIVESVRFDPALFRKVGGSERVYRFREGVIPLLDLQKTWALEGGDGATDNRMVVVVEWGRQSYGLLVDRLLDQQQVVIKSLEENFRRVSGLAGATILGDGAVALILDVGSLGVLIGDRRHHRRRSRRRDAKQDGDRS